MVKNFRSSLGLPSPNAVVVGIAYRVVLQWFIALTLYQMKN